MMTRREMFDERRLFIADGKVQALAGMRRYLEEARDFDCPLAAMEWLVTELEAALAERHYCRLRLARDSSDGLPADAAIPEDDW